MKHSEPIAITLDLDLDLEAHPDLRVQLTLASAPAETLTVKEAQSQALPKPWAPYPKPEKRARPTARPSDDLTYTQFWTHAWQFHGSRDTGPVLKALEVDSMKDWVLQGRTLKSALYVLQALKDGQTLQEALRDLTADSD